MLAGLHNPLLPQLVPQLSSQFVAWTATVDPLATILNAGLAGAVVVAAVLGFIRFKPEVDRLYKIIDQQAETIAAFQAQTNSQTIPMLARTTHVLEEIPERWDNRPPHDQEEALLKQVLGELHRLTGTHNGGDGDGERRARNDS